MRRRSSAAASLCGLLLAGAAGAKDADSEIQTRLETVATSIQRNEGALRQYSWTAQTWLRLKGQLTKTVKEICRFGPEGRLQKQPVAAVKPAGPTGSRRSSPDRKGEDLDNYMDRAVALIYSYLPLSAAKVESALHSGAAAIELGEGGQFQVAICDFLKPGDSVVLSFDPATDSLARVIVNSYLADRKDAVSFGAAFHSLPDGTYYTASTILNANSKQVQISIQNQDYRRLAE